MEPLGHPSHDANDDHDRIGSAPLCLLNGVSHLSAGRFKPRHVNMGQKHHQFTVTHVVSNSGGRGEVSEKCSKVICSAFTLSTNKYTTQQHTKNVVSEIKNLISAVKFSLPISSPSKRYLLGARSLFLSPITQQVNLKVSLIILISKKTTVLNAAYTVGVHFFSKLQPSYVLSTYNTSSILIFLNLFIYPLHASNICACTVSPQYVGSLIPRIEGISPDTSDSDHDA